jgi:hypothetical protein
MRAEEGCIYFGIDKRLPLDNLIALNDSEVFYTWIKLLLAI